MKQSQSTPQRRTVNEKPVIWKQANPGVSSHGRRSCSVFTDLRKAFSFFLAENLNVRILGHTVTNRRTFIPLKMSLTWGQVRWLWVWKHCEGGSPQGREGWPESCPQTSTAVRKHPRTCTQTHECTHGGRKVNEWMWTRFGETAAKTTHCSSRESGFNASTHMAAQNCL